MVSKKRKKIKSKNNAGVIAGLVVLVLLIVFLAYSNINLLTKRSELGEDLSSLNLEQDELLKQRETLKFDLGETYSEAYLERVAREDLDMQKPGETVYVIKKEGESEQEEGDSEGISFLQKLKELFNIE